MDTAPDEAEALRLARACAGRVEVLSARSELEQSFANADGTVTVEIAATPQRVRQDDGSFVPVDTTLVRAGEAVAPVAAVSRIRLSAGGDGDVLSVGRGADAVALSLPDRLPAPALEGDTAVYRGVPVPGVDLRVRVWPEGASTVFVVHTPEAARDPALRRIRLTFAARGLTARPAAGGGISWVDAAGAVVFATGGAAMWESGGRAASAAAARADGATDDAGMWAPSTGARTAKVPVRAAGGALTITPDPAFLAAAAAADAFPVVIDPDISRSSWAMINSRHTTQCYVMCGGYDSADHMKVGWTTDDGGMWYRSLVDFSQASFANKQVLDAKLESYLVHSWNMVDYECTATRTYVHSTAAFGAATTWANHASTWSGALGDSPAVSNCNDAADVRTEWGGPGLTSYVNGRATANGRAYLGLAATSNKSWNKFNENRTKLIVTVNGKPTAPSGLATYNQAVGVAALPCGGRPVLRSATPTVKAKPNDPDGSAETDLGIRFTFQRWTGTAWAALGSPVSTAMTLTTSEVGAYTIPAAWGVAHGNILRWSAETLDRWTYGGSSGVLDSTPSVWCEFEVDAQAPAAPPGVSSAGYPAYVPNVQEDYHGGVGRTADFTFTAGGVPDVAGWYWGWSNPPSTYVAAPAPGGSRTVAITPPPAYPRFPTERGVLTLYVRSVDRTGLADGTNALRTYIMRIGGGTAPVASWKLDEPAGATTFADSAGVGAAHPAVPSGATPGHAGPRVGRPAVRFDGNDHAATTGGAVLDATKGFTVATWARPTSVATWGSVVAQDGVRTNAPFAVNIATGGAWSFNLHSQDGSPTSYGVAATTPARVGMWTHVTAVYDPGSPAGKQLRLYVDGVHVGTEAVPGAGTFASAAPISLGRTHWQGIYDGYFTGDLADVKVWDRAVPGEQAAMLAGVEVGTWLLDDDGADSSGHGRDLTPTGAVTYAAGKTKSGAFFTGSQSLATAGPVLYTNQSFTVAAWVRQDASTGLHTALGQDGTTNSGAYLRHQNNMPGNVWAFGMRTQDDASGVQASAWRQDAPARTWTHLVGVYDATAGTMRLYVNGVLADTAAHQQSWHAGGPFRIGWQKYLGLPTDFWVGGVDEVRAYQGALPPSAVANLYQP